MCLFEQATWRGVSFQKPLRMLREEGSPSIKYQHQLERVWRFRCERYRGLTKRHTQTPIIFATQQLHKLERRDTKPEHQQKWSTSDEDIFVLIAVDVDTKRKVRFRPKSLCLDAMPLLTGNHRNTNSAYQTETHQYNLIAHHSPPQVSVISHHLVKVASKPLETYR